MIDCFVLFCFLSHASTIGKVIGGTSTINWMLYNRGNRRSYDNWYTTYGCDGWDYNSILPYFIRSENNTSPKIVQENRGYHGTNGPMGVSPMAHPDPMLYVFQQQMNSFGIPTIDINGESQMGTMIYELTVNNGTRCSTGNSYIDPNPYPNNLHIMANSFVTKILFEHNNQTNNITAIGVEFTRNGNNYTVMANNEVILSAGKGPKKNSIYFNLFSIDLKTNRMYCITTNPVAFRHWSTSTS